MCNKATLYLLVPTKALPLQYCAGLCKVGITSKDSVEERFSWMTTRGYTKVYLTFKSEMFAKNIERKIKSYFSDDKIKHYPEIQKAHNKWLSTFGGREEWFVESPFLCIKNAEQFKLSIAKHLNLPITTLEKMLVTC